MTSLQGYLPPPGSTNWHRAKSNSFNSNESAASIRHAIIREVWLEKRPKPHAVYKIEVMSHSSHWFVFRRYKEFYNLHQKMAKRFGIPKDFLPPKKLTNSMARETLEIRREALEHYLQRLINSCDREVSSWPDLQEFLDLQGHDVSLVAMSLARHFAKNGESIIASNELFMMTPAQLHCVTKQLQLPHPEKPDDSVDLIHLYDFVARLGRLGITDLISKASKGKQFEVNYSYDLSMFSKLNDLLIDGCRISSIAGVHTLPQRLKSLSVRYCLNTMKEFLIDCAAEKRPAPAVKEMRESWRTHAAFRLSNKRVIVQPWISLTSINMSHNNIVCLDTSMNLLPALRELDLSSNKIAHLDLSLLEESPLQRLTLINNEIYLISGSTKTLNDLKKLDLRQNRVQSMEGLLCAQGLTALDLSHNLIVVISEFRKLAALENLKQLAVSGNPVSKQKRHRIMVFASFRHREIQLDGRPMTRKEKAKLDAKFESEKETDFDDNMSISTVSDDDLDSGIDGHVPSLEPLFEEEDYIVVDREMNLDFGKQCSVNDKILGETGDEKCSVAYKDSIIASHHKDEDSLSDRSRLESFGSYRESLAANWKPGTCLGGAKKRPIQTNTGDKECPCAGDMKSDDNKRITSFSRRLNGDKLKESRLTNRLQNDLENDRRNLNNPSKFKNMFKRTSMKDQSITSFDKIIIKQKSPSRKPRQFDAPFLQDSGFAEFKDASRCESKRNTQDMMQSEIDGATNSCVASGLINTKYQDKDIVILPNVNELRIQDHGEDELWNGEDECEAGTECEEFCE